MRAADIITAAVLLGLGGVVLADALRLGIGWGTDGPQSGFFPFWLAVLLLVFCLVILVQAVRRGTAAPFVTREQAGRVAKVLAPLAAFVIVVGGVDFGEHTLLPGVGLYVAAAIYMAFYMRWVGRHSWLVIALLSVAVPVVAFFVFERWFLVPMPKGPLETWLGY
jgi:putative tricarboxylic transport membrane protein